MPLGRQIKKKKAEVRVHQMNSRSDLNNDVFMNKNVVLVDSEAVINGDTIVNSGVNSRNACVGDPEIVRNSPRDTSNKPAPQSLKIEQLRKVMGQLRGQFIDFMNGQLRPGASHNYSWRRNAPPHFQKQDEECLLCFEKGSNVSSTVTFAEN